MNVVKTEKDVLFSGYMEHMEAMKNWMKEEGHTLETVKVVQKGDELIVYKR